MRERLITDHGDAEVESDGHTVWIVAATETEGELGEYRDGRGAVRTREGVWHRRPESWSVWRSRVRAELGIIVPGQHEPADVAADDMTPLCQLCDQPATVDGPFVGDPLCDACATHELRGDL